MMGRDPDAQRVRTDHERERRVQFDSLAVDAGMHRSFRVHSEVRRCPGSGRRIRARVRLIEHDDAELAAVEPRPRSGRDRAVERVGIVRHEHDGEVTMLLAEVVDERNSGAARVGPSTSAVVSSSARTFASR